MSKIHRWAREGNLQKIKNTTFCDSTIREIKNKKLNQPSINEKVEGLTPLMVAAWYNQFKMVELLLNLGADPNLKGPNGTVFHYALARNSEDSKYSNVNNSQLKTMRKLLCFSNEKINSRHGGFTPLQVAYRQSNLSIVKLLLSNNADPKIYRKFSDSIIVSAIQNNNLGLVKEILKNSDGVKPRDLFSLFIFTIKCNRKNILDYLIQHSGILKAVDVNRLDNNGLAPIHYACKHDKIFNLVSKIPSIDLNMCDKKERTPLHIAAKHNSTSTVRQLLSDLQTQGQIDAKNSSGLNPFQYAVLTGSKLMFLLSEHQPNFILKVIEDGKYAGKTALHLAATSRNSNKVTCYSRKKQITNLICLFGMIDFQLTQENWQAINEIFEIARENDYHEVLTEINSLKRRNQESIQPLPQTFEDLRTHNSLDKQESIQSLTQTFEELQIHNKLYNHSDTHFPTDNDLFPQNNPFCISYQEGGSTNHTQVSSDPSGDLQFTPFFSFKQ